jgi:hypothetical protein
MAINLTIPTPTWSAMTLSGAKTYLVAAGTIAYASLAYWHGAMSLDQAVDLAVGAAGLGTLRHGLTTSTALAAERYAQIMLDEIKRQSGIQQAVTLSSASSAQRQVSIPFIQTKAALPLDLGGWIASTGGGASAPQVTAASPTSDVLLVTGVTAQGATPAPIFTGIHPIKS